MAKLTRDPYEGLIVERGEWLEEQARRQQHNATTLEVAGVGARQTITSWFNGTYPNRKGRRGLKRVLGITEEQLQNGPWHLASGTTQPGSEVALLDMLAAARKIAVALQQDLERTEIPTTPILDGATEKGRQQALVWALKDLARQLHHLGFDMRSLFDVTDDLAREIGLPVRKNQERK